MLRVRQHGVADPRDGRARHRVAQAPEEVAPGDRLADRRLHVARLARADGVHGLQEQAGDEVELHREARAALQNGAGQEAGVREEGVRLLDVLVHEDVLPRHEGVVEHEDRVVLVEAAGQGVVERAAHHLGRHAIGRPTDQLDARRVHGRDERQRERLGLDGHGARMGDEVGVRERRAGGDDLRPADDEPGVRLSLHVHVDVGDLVWRAVAVDRRLDEGVVHVEDALLRHAVPAPGVVLVGGVEGGVRAERGEEGRLVVGRPAHPPIAQARPGGDGVARVDQLGGARRGAEVAVGEALRASVGGAREHGARGGLVQRVVEPRQHARGVAEGRVRGHVLDPLAVDPDLPAGPQTLEELRARERSSGLLCHGRSSPRAIGPPLRRMIPRARRPARGAPSGAHAASPRLTTETSNSTAARWIRLAIT